MAETLAERTARTRRLAADLAACPGWTELALPHLQAAVGRLEDAILTQGDLRGQGLDDTRAGYLTVTRLFKDLRAEIEQAFVNPPQEAGDVPPQLIMAQMSLPPEIAAALTLTGVRPPPPAAPPPPAPIPPAPTFNPFAENPVPLTPNPTPP